MTLPVTALLDWANLVGEFGTVAAEDRTHIERLCKSASSFVERYCHRVFSYDAAIVEYQAGYGTAHLVLERTPVKSITSITVNGSTLSSSDYSIASADAGLIWASGGWPWTALIRGGDIAGDGAPDSEEKSIVVTYKGGYVCPGQVTAGPPALTRDLPDEIEDAVIQLVVARFAGRGVDPRVQSEKTLSSSVSYFDREIPAMVASLLAPYRRLVQA
jgi:hypothetical protein